VSLAALARAVQSAANRRDLVRRQCDRDRILAVLHAGTRKGDSAAARLAAAAEELARLEADMDVHVTALRNALADLTVSQGPGDDQSAPSKPKRKRKHEPDP
jgi:hypothetical protein